MRTNRILFFCLMAVSTAAAGATDRALPADGEGFAWESSVPSDCPFPRSPSLTGLFFTGRHSDYRCGDTFYPSWARAGNLYSPWTDGGLEGMVSGSSHGEKAKTGHAVMIGDDPLNLEIHNTSPPKTASARPYQGRYPCGSLVHDGIWYYGTYCLGPGDEALRQDASQLAVDRAVRRLPDLDQLRPHLDAATAHTGETDLR